MEKNELIKKGYDRKTIEMILKLYDDYLFNYFVGVLNYSALAVDTNNNETKLTGIEVLGRFLEINKLIQLKIRYGIDDFPIEDAFADSPTLNPNYSTTIKASSCNFDDEYDVDLVEDEEE